ncbi:(2Fe-2S)-binding protein [Cellulophaga sp. F20128]|uniref:2Fe-2S iron-sulfur cluster-binding protein n=1 Tax=Cellulophaga sp. F20128 TaxID=2926413 RepID=UPI001FF5A32D|nr:2Fe-2S iron-sulfur cluster-binding protein [Cellulophaga sp. F20128]MCK0156131.1 (2Fe-2S)-binding protein [Cellulophaga sp. F20128]
MPRIDDQVYTFTFYDEVGEKYEASFVVNEYHSLMELLFDKYAEDWGDCRGRAWCGTCHIEILDGIVEEAMDADERNTLSKLTNTVKTSRLACQIPVNSKLNNLVFKILKDN